MLKLTARLVSAYVRTNDLPADQLPELIATVQSALFQAPHPQPEEPPATPAVPVRRSVTADAIICLECGWTGKALRRHLLAAHGLTPADYRDRFGLPATYPLTAPAYAEKRSRLAKEQRLGKKVSETKPGDNKEPEAIAEQLEAKPGFRYPPSRWAKPAR